MLDLFKGFPSKEKLSLWSDDAVFEDPLTDARGRKQYEAQWVGVSAIHLAPQLTPHQYGLAAAFSSIENLSHTVTSSGNPIIVDAKNKYVVKGINQEKIINSKIEIHTGPTGQIEKVLDKWDGNIPDGPIASVSTLWQLMSPLWWLAYGGEWAFWLWSLTWNTRVWHVRRRFFLRW